MKIAAWLLFIAGTLVAAASGAKLEPLWVPFGIGIVVAVVGAVMLRRSQDPAGSVSEEQGGIKDLATLRTRFEGLVSQIGDAREVEGDALKDVVEDALMEQLLPIIDARLLLAAAHGIEGYAGVFTPTAAGERCLNRAWSMLVDGGGDPGAQVSAAHGHLERALAAWPAT